MPVLSTSTAKRGRGVVFVLATAAAIVLIFFAGSARAGCAGVGESGKDYGCGDVVTESCTFNEDLSCPPGHGLIIGADGITIDGAGYKITGSETADACEWVTGETPEKGYCGILNKGYDNVMIKNLEIENFCTGIAFQGSGQNPVVNCTITNCEIHDNGNATCSSDTSIHGIHLCYVSECTISNSRIHHNTGAGDSCEAGGNGIFLYAGSEAFTNNTITKNEIYDNRKSGFFTKMKLHHARITDNHVYGNGQGGIVLRCRMSNYNLIEGNNASCNYGDGIFIGGENNTIRNNVVRNNIAGFKIGPRDVIGDGDGINMGRSQESNNNSLIANEVCDNEGVDIEVVEGCIGNHGRDNTCDTTTNYNDEGTEGCSNACPEEINAEELAKELTEQGWVMYGTDRCPFCIKQKAEFGDAFKYINYINCGLEENRQACEDFVRTCKEAGIKEEDIGIPAWISPNGTPYIGYHDLVKLSNLASEYRAAQPAPAPTATPTATATSSPISTPTPGFESVLAVIAVIIVTLSFFSKRELRTKRRK